MKPNIKLFQEAPLSDYILIVTGVLSDEQCDRFLQASQDSADWNPVGSESNSTDPALRNCDTLDISLLREQSPWALLDSDIYKAVETCIRTYRLKFPGFTAGADTGYEMLRYPTGTRCNYHSDSRDFRPRTLSCSIAINDDYKGGEFEFFHGEKTYRVPKGSAIVFPSNFMYPHAVLPITEGTRYSIITWLV